MKKTLLLAFILLVSNQLFAQTSDWIVGKWLNGDKNAQIQVYQKGNKYHGKIVWLKNPTEENGKPRIDDKNPDSNLKNRPLIGLELLKGFIFDEDTWINGTIYDPKSGKIYSCKITANSKDELNVRGYLGISLIGRTDVWTRVK